MLCFNDREETKGVFKQGTLLLPEIIIMFGYYFQKFKDIDLK